MLGPGKTVELIYAGDRMVPALRHGRTLSLQAPSERILPGDVVVASPAGIPDVFRVDRLDGDEALLTADADPSPAARLPRGLILARVHLPSRRIGRRGREIRRFALDLGEAWMGRRDPAPTASDSVRAKYDTQAPYYVASPG